MLSDFQGFLSKLTESSGLNKFEDRKRPKDSAVQPKRLKINPSEIGYVDLQKLEHGTRNLQRSIKLITKEAPDYNEYQRLCSSQDIDETVRVELKQNKLVELSSIIRSKYNNGKLDIFDAIVNDSLNISEEDLKQPTLPKILDETHISKESIEVNEEPKDDKFPELPKINDPFLYQRVFIHKSTINNKSYLDPSELINSHNERLEFLGDSILNNLVTLIIYDKFPEASEGELSKIRSLLINNSVLTEFSIAYGFDKKLRSNINETILRQGKQKIYADIFEAYIGALTLEHGLNFSEIKDWLAKLMDSRLKKFDKKFKQIEPINKDAKSELYSLIGTAAFHPIYETVQHGDGSSIPYIIHCKMGDEILGEGKAPGHKDAGLRAAMNALKKKPLLEKFSQYRLNLDRSDTVISQKTPKPPAAPVPNEFSIASIDKSLFPLRASMTDALEPEAKNSLYALLGKSIGVVPEYVTYDEGDKKKTELRIQGFTVVTSLDHSKKNSMTRAAMCLLNDKNALNQIIGSSK